MITFIKHNDDLTATMRGDQLAEEINTLGIEARAIPEKEYMSKCHPSGEVVVMIKRVNKETILRAKQNNATIVFDVLDNEEIWRSGFGSMLPCVDAMIASSSALMLMRWAKPAHQKLIHQHPDPRYKPNAAAEFSAAYIGSLENLEKKYIHLPFDKMVGVENIHENIRAYSCHVCVRTRGSEKYLQKPASKLVAAAGCRANIVLTTDVSHVDLLPITYPYFTGSAEESVEGTLEYAKKTYGMPVWKEGLDMMEEVRKKTCIRRAAESYLEFFHDIGGMI